MTYDAFCRVETVSQPGRGTITVHYDPITGLVQEVIAPDRVSTKVAVRAPSTDGVQEILQDRGEGGALSSFFRYDGFERLFKSWQDFGGSNEATPLDEIAYAFPTASTPGLVTARSVLDSAAQIEQRGATLLAADGEALTSATRVFTGEGAEGWVFGGLSKVQRAQLQSEQYRRPPLARENLRGLTYPELFEQAVSLSQSRRTGFSGALDDTAVLQTRADQSLVRKHTETKQELTKEGLLTTVEEHGENGKLFTSSSLRDNSGLLRWTEDQATTRTQYSYDALGRLTKVLLPDGSEQSVEFDDFARPVLVSRPGVGAIRYDYAPETGMLQDKTFEDRDGEPERKITLGYDPAGRVTEERHELVESKEAQTYSFEYDGGLEHPIRGQRGFLTRVTGPEYEKIAIFNPDGTLQQQVIRLSRWLEVTHDHLYYADGTPRIARRTTVDLQTSQPVETVEKEMVYDRLGRLDKILVNGTALVRMIYNPEGKLDSAIFPEGQIIKLLYDMTTKELNGYTRSSSVFDFGLDWKLNERGLIEQESISFGNDYWDRAYGYDGRGFLESSKDKEQGSAYTYTPSGLIETLYDQKGARTITRSNKELRIGPLTYVLDKLGRVIQKADLHLEYGPNGHLSLAQRKGTGMFLQYFYDETGQRILKLENGKPVAGYLGESYLTQEGLIEPIKLGGILVGILDRGIFHLLATDPRGTPLADRDGTRNFPTPYGVRTTLLVFSAALDYVEKGYDADLGTVRMGVRDYDPYLGQFITPDPLFLEDIENCLKSPVECNLYGYALNNPVNVIDPTGLGGRSIHREALRDTFNLDPIHIDFMLKGSDNVDNIRSTFLGRNTEPLHSMLASGMSQAEGLMIRTLFVNAQVAIAKLQFDRSRLYTADAAIAMYNGDTAAGERLYGLARSALLEGYFHAGEAFHPFQDQSSYLHVAGGQWQEWPSLGKLGLDFALTMVPFSQILFPYNVHEIQTTVRHGEFLGSKFSWESLETSSAYEFNGARDATRRATKDNFQGYEEFFPMH